MSAAPYYRSIHVHTDDRARLEAATGEAAHDHTASLSLGPSLHGWTTISIETSCDDAALTASLAGRLPCSILLVTLDRIGFQYSFYRHGQRRDRYSSAAGSPDAGRPERFAHLFHGGRASLLEARRLLAAARSAESPLAPREALRQFTELIGIADTVPAASLAQGADMTDAADTPPGQPSSLGPVLATRRPSTRELGRATLFCAICTALCCSAGTAPLLSQTSRVNPADLAIQAFAVVGLLASFVGLSVWRSLRRRRFDFHESGLSIHDRASILTVPYSAIADLRFESVQREMDRTHSLTRQRLTFHAAGERLVELRFSYREQAGQLADGDLDLAPIVTHVATRIRGRMLESLRSGHAVDWTRHHRITADGILLPSQQLLPWSAIRRMGMALIGSTDQTPYLQIFTHGSDQPVVRLDNTDPNFLPGYLLVQDLYAHASGQATATPARAAA